MAEPSRVLGRGGVRARDGSFALSSTLYFLGPGLFRTEAAREQEKHRGRRNASERKALEQKRVRQPSAVTNWLFLWLAF